MTRSYERAALEWFRTYIKQAGLLVGVRGLNVRLKEYFAASQEKERNGKPTEANADEHPGVDRYEFFHIIVCC
jgi:hypothetical protein